MILSEIAEALGAEVFGDGTLEIDRAAHPAEAASPRDLALAMDKKTLALLPQSAARAAIVAAGAEVAAGSLDGWIAVSRPRFAMAGITRVFERKLRVDPGVHPSAVVDPGAKLGEGVAIGPFVHIGSDAAIGDGTTILSHASVGADAVVGSDCILHAGVRIGERVVVGDRTIIQPNAAIGADGFSFVTPERGSVETAKSSGRIDAMNTAIVRINSLGSVVIGSDVEIGACAAIDRGTVSNTTVGDGTKIDDMVLIGHNVRIGSNCMICGQVGIAGSATIGDRVVLAGQVGVADHVTIGDDVVIGAGSGVGSDIPSKTVAVGYPAIPKAKKLEEVLHIRRLRGLYDDVDALKRRLKAVESASEKR